MSYIDTPCPCETEGYCEHYNGEKQLVVGNWWTISRLDTPLGRKYREILSRPKQVKKCNCREIVTGPHES